MWPFKRKAKNRRNERGSVLDVRMRSRSAGTARMRVATAAIGAVGGTALCLLLGWQALQWGLHRFVYANDAYTIRRIELRHEGRLRPEALLRWAGVDRGQNLLALDLDRVRRDLEMNPWIARAEVESRRPDTLRLSVYEREPVAQVVIWRLNRAEGHAWPETNLVDASGFVMPPLRSEWLRPATSADFGHLTRLAGLETVEIMPGQRLERRQVQAGLSLIRSYEDSSMYSLVDLYELNVGASDVLEGVVRQGTRVTFGTWDFDRQMRRWRSIHEHARTVGRELAWLDLSVTNNLPARWVESTNAVPAPPPTRVPRKSPTPRRHV